jgi:hypothetical protein
MGVERQTAKVNWLSSLAMIVTAGTLYRVRNLTKSLSATQIKDILAKYGFMNSAGKYSAIVGQQVKGKVGEW